jgi:hypothetical protein
MKLFDRVAVVCDETFVEHASATRAFLEAMRLRVDFYRLVQRRNVLDFFGRDAARYDYTVLWSHGLGDGDGMAVRLQVVDQAEGDLRATTGWSGVQCDLTVETIPEIVTGVSGGTLVALGCGAGRPPLAQAFLAAGYDGYIGSTPKYYDADAALLFTTSFFYYLLAEDRDFEDRTHTVAQAVHLAAAADPGFRCGPGVMRYYTSHL